jgi:hypothetical protein
MITHTPLIADNRVRWLLNNGLKSSMDTQYMHHAQYGIIILFSVQVVNKKYQEEQARPGHSQPIDFESEQITLDIPMTGVTSEGWTIDPSFPPIVSYSKVAIH